MSLIPSPLMSPPPPTALPRLLDEFRGSPEMVNPLAPLSVESSKIAGKSSPPGSRVLAEDHVGLASSPHHGPEHQVVDAVNVEVARGTHCSKLSPAALH